VLKLAIAIALLAIVAAIGITVFVEHEAAYRLENLGGAGPARALILYHPSRDAHFSDDLSLALASGLKASGFAVDRATLTDETPPRPAGYALIAVVSNTFWATPDWPTLQYLKRARLTGIPVIGLMGGAGSTARAQRLLEQSLHTSGASVIGTRSFWISKPNDESRTQEPNRQVAMAMASQFGAEAKNWSALPGR
jgi:hypothetical protein